MDERSTKFAGVAKLLLDECLKASFVAVETPFQDNWRVEWEQIIAERAYDLVKHAISSIGPYHMDVLTTEETIEDIPDLTEWPEPPVI